MTKEQELISFLQERVFDPILNSPSASNELKQGVRLTIVRMNQRDAAGMISTIGGQSLEPNEALDLLIE